MAMGVRVAVAVVVRVAVAMAALFGRDRDGLLDLQLAGDRGHLRVATGSGGCVAQRLLHVRRNGREVRHLAGREFAVDQRLLAVRLQGDLRTQGCEPMGTRRARRAACLE
jgi:hypothetical protein